MMEDGKILVKAEIPELKTLSFHYFWEKRAEEFSGLHRVMHLGVPLAELERTNLAQKEVLCSRNRLWRWKDPRCNTGKLYQGRSGFRPSHAPKGKGKGRSLGKL